MNNLTLSFVWERVDKHGFNGESCYGKSIDIQVLVKDVFEFMTIFIGSNLFFPKRNFIF